MLVRGGAGEYTPRQLNDLTGRLSIKINTELSDDSLIVTMDCLSEHYETALKILGEIYFKPLFDSGVLEDEKTISAEMIGHRYDNPENLLGAAYSAAMYSGTKVSRFPSEKTVMSVNRKDIADFHSNIMNNSDAIIYISGNISRQKMISDLSGLFSGMKARKTERGLFSGITANSFSRCLIVDKKINQAYIRIGIGAVQRPVEEYYPLALASMILGGGGFTSRLGTEVRSNSGLTYSIYSHVESNYSFQGTFYVDFFTKTESAARASSMCLDVIKKFLAEGPTDEELSNAKKMLVEGLPSYFRSPYDIVSTYARSEFNGNKPDHYISYPSKINSLTKDDVMKSARKYLRPENFVYTVVGDSKTITDQSFGDFSFGKFSPRVINQDDL